MLPPRDEERAEPWLTAPALLEACAVRLLLIAPCEVSPTEPETVTLSNSFCSAPNLRSHLSSVVDSVWPAVMLVPVSVRVTLADWSVS